MKKDLRIASLLPSSTEIICALGLEENLVGITHECDFPASITNLPHLTASRISHETMSSKEIDHAVRSNLDGHGSIYDLDEKLLQELNPDLILTQELCDVCAVSYKTVQKAAKMYVADAKVVSLEPNTIEDIFENIKTVGELCGVSEKADEVVKNLQNRLDKIKERLTEYKNNPKSKIQNLKSPNVFMLEWLEPPFSPGHWVPEQVEIAGGICLTGNVGEKSVTTTYEEIFESKPEIIVLIPCGYYTEDILRQIENTYFPENWREIPAIQNGEVWALDATSYFSRPAPRVVDGTEILSKIFHPEVFGVPTEKEAVRVPKNLLKFSDRSNAKSV
ncbi:MAG: cobalamin-binding protein [Acidobacteriota bacterium]|jgi:iron complex transport system substrate-binding protein|nr:cobalamin-binding protein [Acidobacteriota bacterium]